MPKYFSGRVKRTPQSGLTSDRYQYLGLDQAEPNLGDPPEVDNIPTGNRYQVISVQNHPGERYWLPIGGGVQPGAITVREEGTILPNASGVNSITDLNIKGNIITAEGYLDDDGNPGTGVTITVAPVGLDHEVIFNNNGEFGAASGLSYDNDNNRVGIGSTQPQETLDIDGTLFITGNVFDKEHDSGTENQVLVKHINGGLVWADQSGATAVAAGEKTQVQFHNDDGNLGGAAKLVYDYTNERIGIGSTQPTKLLDVLGDSKFTGATEFDGNVNIDGVLTYEDVTNVDSIGVVTAGKGVRITSEGLIVAGITTLDTTRFPDNTSLYFGADDDLQILHDGSDSIINDNATGSLKLQQGGNTRLEVTGFGITVSGVTTTNVLSVTGFVTSHLIPSPTDNFNLGSQNDRWDYLYVNNIDTGSWSPTVITAEQLRITGLSTFEGLTRHQDGIVVTSGVSTFVGFTTFKNDIFVAGVSTFVGFSTFHGDVGFGGSIVVAGVSTFIGITTSKSTLFAKQFSSGISTLGIASATDLFVSGVSTFVGLTRHDNGIHVTSGVSSIVGFTTFHAGVHVTGFTTFVGISSFEGNVSFNAGIRDKDGQLGGIVDGVAVDGWILESRNDKINWVNPQGLTVEKANKIGVGSIYSGPALTDAGIKTHFVTFVDTNHPYDGRDYEKLYSTGLFVYDPQNGGRVGIGTTIPNTTLNVSGITSFKGSVYFDGVQNNVGFTSLTWQSSVGRLEFRDNVKATFGTDDDFEIYYDAADTGHSVLHSEQKTISIRSGNTVEIEDENKNSLAEFHADGNVELYWNGTPATGESVGKKLATSGIGITVTGLTSTTELMVKGAFYDSSNSYGASSGHILETNQASGVSWVNPTDLAFGKANKIGVGSINSADTGIGTHFITFVDVNNPYNGREYELLYSTGLFVYDPQDGGRVGIGTTIPSDTLSVTGISSFNGEVYFNSGVTGITSIGWNPSSSALEFKDDVKAVFGNDDDLQIYLETGTGGNPDQSTIYSPSKTLSILSGVRVEIEDEVGNNIAVFTKGGSSELHYRGSTGTGKKFETSGVGVTVYGSISIYDSDASNKITLQPPATEDLIANYTLTLPQDDGGPNEVLTTDGSGVLSWTTKAAGTAVAAGSNQQVQYNNNNVLAGAAELLFDNSTTAPTLILKPNIAVTEVNGANGGYIQARNAGSTNTTLNAATISHDGGLELKRTNETVASGGPFIDFKYDATDMDARIQMDIVGGTTSDDKFSAIRFLTGGGNIYDSVNEPNGRVTEKLRIGKDGEIGIQGGAQVYDASTDTVATNHRTSAQIYGTPGQVLKSNGLGASVYWGTEGTGSGLAAVQVKQYSDDLSQNDPRTVRTCDALDAPITVATNSGTAVIGIGSTSNAYGNRYIGDTEPTGNLCDGDIWYDTSVSAGANDLSTGITRVALIKDAKNYDVNGGGFTKDGWRDRDLTEIEDPQSFVDFNSNGGTKTTTSTGIKPGYWSLQPGTYKIEWSAPGLNINRHQSRLVYSTTETQISAQGLHGSASFVEGSTENTTGDPDAQGTVPTLTRSVGSKVIKITERTWFKIMHICTENSAPNATTGFGRRLGGANAGAPDNIYTEVRIEDLATAVKEVDVVNTGKTKVALLKDQKGSQVHGGGFTEFGWRDRDLTVKEDPYGFVNFTEGGTQSDQSEGITPGYWSLQPGTYKIEWEAPGMNVNRHQSKLVWSTDSVKISTAGLDSDIVTAGDYAQGSSENATGGTWTGQPDGTIPTATHSTGCKIITITQPTWFKILHYCNRTLANTGFGQRLSSQTSTTDFSIYTQVKIEDLATAIKELDITNTGKTKVCLIEDVKDPVAQGGDATGTNVGGSWMTRDLNTINDDGNIGITIANNRISLPAGTYRVKWNAPAFSVNDHQTRLAYSVNNSNFTNTLTTVPGSSEWSPPDNYSWQTRSFGETIVTASETTFLEIQHRVHTSRNTDGLGIGSWTGENGIFTQVIIEDLATAVKESEIVNTGKTRLAKVEEIGAYGNTGAGTFAQAQWITRSLTNLTDPHNIGITLNTTDNYITVPAGTYSIKWSAPAMMVDRHVARLLYSSDSSFSFNSAQTTDVYGEVAYTEYDGQYDVKNSYTQTRSTGFLPSVTFTDTKYIKVQHYSDRGNIQSGDAMGVSSPWGSATANNTSPPIWTTIEIEDLATAVKEADIVNPGNTKVAVVKDEKNKGVQGGNFGDNAWRDRDLTVKDDPFSFVTLYPSVRSNGTDPKATLSNGDTPGYFSLPAGKYKITFSAVAHDVGRNTAAIIWDVNESIINKVYDFTTDASQLDGHFYGTSMACAGASTLSKGSNVVEISQTSFFKVIHFCKSTNSGSGFGQATDIGDVDKETYLVIEIEDLATAVKEPSGTDIPVGGIIMYSGTETELNALTNWKLCNGLNGTPNLADKFVICGNNWETHSGTDKWVTRVETGSAPGTETGGSKNAVLLAHEHKDPTYNAQSGQYEPAWQNPTSGYDYGTQAAPTEKTAIDADGNITTGDSATQTGDNANLPPYFALAYIMKIS